MGCLLLLLGVILLGPAPSVGVILIILGLFGSCPDRCDRAPYHRN